MLLARAAIQVNHLHLLSLLLGLPLLHLLARETFFSALLHLITVLLELGSVRAFKPPVHLFLEMLVLWAEQAVVELGFAEDGKSQLALRLFW